MRVILGGLTGASDPNISDLEMLAIQDLAVAAGLNVLNSTPDGPGAVRECYNSQIIPQEGDIWVECRPAGHTRASLEEMGCVVIDHHFDGDSGFDVKLINAPFARSSLGQFLLFLGRKELGCKVAQDLGWQYAPDCGQCFGYGGLSHPAPGVWILNDNNGECEEYEIPDNLVWIGEADHNLAWFLTQAGEEHQQRVDQRSWMPGPRRAWYLGLAGSPTESDLEEAMTLLRRAPVLHDGIRDIRNIPELQINGRLGRVVVPAACMSGQAYVAWGVQGVTDKGRHVGVGGLGEGTRLGPYDFRPMLSDLGAVGIYGHPSRGVGGGYIPE